MDHSEIEVPLKNLTRLSFVVCILYRIFSLRVGI
jgi:hypothetical protein